MDRSYYAPIEVGSRNVTLESMRKNAKGFGISTTELLAGIES